MYIERGASKPSFLKLRATFWSSKSWFLTLSHYYVIIEYWNSKCVWNGIAKCKILYCRKADRVQCSDEPYIWSTIHIVRTHTSPELKWLSVSHSDCTVLLLLHSNPDWLWRSFLHLSDKGLCSFVSPSQPSSSLFGLLSSASRHKRQTELSLVYFSSYSFAVPLGLCLARDSDVF